MELVQSVKCKTYFKTCVCLRVKVWEGVRNEWVKRRLRNGEREGLQS